MVPDEGGTGRSAGKRICHWRALVTETAWKPFNPTFAFIANVVVGGGLVLSALTLFVIRDLPPFAHWLLSQCGVLSIALTIVACAIASSKRESKFARRLATSAGVVA